MLIPELLDLALLSPKDCGELESKSENAVKEHPDDPELFQYALEKLKEHENHQTIPLHSKKEQKGMYLGIINFVL